MQEEEGDARVVQDLWGETDRFFSKSHGTARIEENTREKLWGIGMGSERMIPIEQRCNEVINAKCATSTCPSYTLSVLFLSNGASHAGAAGARVDSVHGIHSPCGTCVRLSL